MSIAIEVVRRGRKNHCYIHFDGFQKMDFNFKNTRPSFEKA
jgi:hypothetical protein